MDEQTLIIMLLAGGWGEPEQPLPSAPATSGGSMGIAIEIGISV